MQRLSNKEKDTLLSELCRCYIDGMSKNEALAKIQKDVVAKGYTETYGNRIAVYTQRRYKKWTKIIVGHLATKKATGDTEPMLITESGEKKPLVVNADVEVQETTVINGLPKMKRYTRKNYPVYIGESLREEEERIQELMDMQKEVERAISGYYRLKYKKNAKHLRLITNTDGVVSDKWLSSLQKRFYKPSDYYGYYFDKSKESDIREAICRYNEYVNYTQAAVCASAVYSNNLKLVKGAETVVKLTYDLADVISLVERKYKGWVFEYPNIVEVVDDGVLGRTELEKTASMPMNPVIVFENEEYKIKWQNVPLTKAEHDFTYKKVLLDGRAAIYTLSALTAPTDALYTFTIIP